MARASYYISEARRARTQDEVQDVLDELDYDYENGEVSERDYFDIRTKLFRIQDSLRY